MAISFPGTPTKFADSTNFTTRDLSYISGGTTNDWYHLVVGSDGGAVNTPTGWTLKEYVFEPGDSCRQYLFVRKYTGSEGSTVTITSDSDKLTGIMYIVRGADSTDSIDVISTAAGELGKAPNARCPNAWNACLNSYVIRAVTGDGGSTFTTPASHTLLDSQAEVGTSGVGVAIAYKSAASAGYVDSAYFASSAATEEYCGMTIIVRSTSTLESFGNNPVMRCMSFITPPTNAGGAFRKPYGTVSGDFLIMSRVMDGTYANNVNTAYSFSTAAHSDNGGAVYLYTDYKYAGGSEPTDYTAFTASAGAYGGSLRRYVNVHATLAWDQFTSNTGTNTAPTGSTLTPSVDNCMIEWSAGADDDDVTYDTGYPSGHTGMYAVGQQEAADCTLMLSHLNQTTKGATGSVAGSLDLTEEWVVHLYAIRPLVASGTTNLRLGTGTPSKVYLGTGEISKIYLGTTTVWQP